MDIIYGDATERALKENGRVYLCGNLALPNGVDHIKTDGYEIGISYYPQFSVDKPHYHYYNTEYNYVISGEMKVLLIKEEKQIQLKTGDLLVIHPDEPYICKSLPGTKVLFSKVPGGNDKVVIPTSEMIDGWGSCWEASGM